MKGRGIILGGGSNWKENAMDREDGWRIACKMGWPLEV